MKVFVTTRKRFIAIV